MDDSHVKVEGPFQAYRNEVYLLPKALDENVTKLHIPHSVQSSPSLLVNMQFLEVSNFKGLKGTKVGNIKPQVVPFVFPVLHGVSVLASGRHLNFGLRPLAIISS